MSHQNTEDILYDSRVVERNIAAGKITREQYEAYLASLEDCADRSRNTDTRFVHGAGDEANRRRR